MARQFAAAGAALFFVVTIPFGVVYFMTHLLNIETQVSDATNLSDFLRSRK